MRARGSASARQYHPPRDTAPTSAGAHGAGFLHALHAGRRAGQLGAVDGDNAAALPLYECRLERLAAELLADIDKETVDFASTTTTRPGARAHGVPSRIPNLLLRTAHRASRSAWRPHPAAQPSGGGGRLPAAARPAQHRHRELIKLMPAPDFRLRVIIYGINGVHEGYRTARPRGDARAHTIRGHPGQERPADDRRRRAAYQGKRRRCSSASPSRSPKSGSKASRTSATSPTSRASAWVIELKRARSPRWC